MLAKILRFRTPHEQVLQIIDYLISQLLLHILLKSAIEVLLARGVLTVAEIVPVQLQRRLKGRLLLPPRLLSANSGLCLCHRVDHFSSLDCN